MNGKGIAWLGLLAAVGFGCEVSRSDGLAEHAAELAELQEESGWSAGCYWDCGPCEGDDCNNCAMVCPAGVYCGDKRCNIDEVCCNEGCGICAQPGASCARHACLTEPECSDDSDCNATADYCAGCDCVAVSEGEEVTACPGPGVKCFADPCGQRQAVCKNSRCVVE